MKKLMLLGDSIRLGYQDSVKNALDGEFDVWGPDENGRFAKYTLNELGRIFSAYTKRCTEEQNQALLTPGEAIGKDIIKPDVIHWNNGLWDTSIVCVEDGPFTPIPEYIDYMSKILRELRKITGKIIFASTTPVKPQNPNQKNDIITEYNKHILDFMDKNKVVVNDLNALVSQDVNKYLSPDNIHLSEEGKRVCAEQIAKCVREISK
ncbi:MAG: SGNH/GDSL hydrolase family protein [Clostridia bacterium]|nr:SGNH/GDSL hydrolase family protein [Clostridia bacterium]